MVEPQPSKLMAWVRFPSPAPTRRDSWQKPHFLLAGDGVMSAESAVGDFQPMDKSADVAQLVEHVLGKDEVTGSIPVVGSSEFMVGRK